MADLIAIQRERLKRERGFIKKDWGGKVSIALVYPNTYRVGMSNLGFQVMYRLLNSRDDVVAERVFLPKGRELDIYKKTRTPLLSIESQSPLTRFHIVSFSIPFENDYLNVLDILSLGRIPLLAEERCLGNWPFVMAGGVTTFLNPEPLSLFVDFFLLGEAEANLDRFLDLFIDTVGIRGNGSASTERKDIIRRLSKGEPSLYAPSLYRPEYNADGTLSSLEPLYGDVKARVKVAKSIPLGKEVSRTAVTTPDTEFPDKVVVELSRGCGCSCRFCAAGYVYRPPRMHDISVLFETVRNALDVTPFIGLLSACVSDVPGIFDLTSMILERGGGFSVSSLRADTLTGALLDNLKKAGQKTVTIAPESGTERLRRVINKHLPDDRIIEAVRLIAKRAFNLKMYFLIGLPSETHDDIRGIVNLVKIIKHNIVKESAPRGKIAQITLSVNSFVPKPFTPFQWVPMDNVEALKKKQKYLKTALKKEGGTRIHVDVPKWAYIQTLLAKGDRRVGKILLNSHRRGGDWTKAMRYSEVNPDFFVYRPQDIDETLPWDFIDNGISKKYLSTEYAFALEGKETPMCNVGRCYRCGVCKEGIG